MGDIESINKYMTDLREKFHVTIVLPRGGKASPLHANDLPYGWVFVDMLDILK